jgi:hypothetical protein
MSLARIALRLAAIEAVRGKTLVGQNVLDSQIGALDTDADGNFKTDQDAPFISVYVEGGIIEEPARSATLLRPGETDIQFEFGITAAMTETDPDTDVTTLVGMQVPATDGAFEMQLDVIDRQIVNALSDPTNEWAAIWRDLSSETTKIVRRRTSDGGNGVRIAAHQIVISLKLLPEPAFGVVIDQTSVYKRFFDKMAEIDHPYTELLVSLVQPSGASTLDVWRRSFGLSSAHAEILGQGEGVWSEVITTVIDSDGDMAAQPEGGLAP